MEGHAEPQKQENTLKIVKGEHMKHSKKCHDLCARGKES
jgi:hypothetical protein